MLDRRRLEVGLGGASRLCGERLILGGPLGQLPTGLGLRTSTPFGVDRTKQRVRRRQGRSRSCQRGQGGFQTEEYCRLDVDRRLGSRDQGIEFGKTAASPLGPGGGTHVLRLGFGGAAPQRSEGEPTVDGDACSVMDDAALGERDHRQHPTDGRLGETRSPGNRWHQHRRQVRAIVRFGRRRVR